MTTARRFQHISLYISIKNQPGPGGLCRDYLAGHRRVLGLVTRMDKLYFCQALTPPSKLFSNPTKIM